MIRDFPVGDRLDGTGAPPGPPVPPRDAATVLLVRDGPDGVEVFAFRRVRRMAFAAGMLVFPGGGVDARDADEGVPWRGPAPEVLAPVLGSDAPGARALVVAAVRETFEECGVLLASPPGLPGEAPPEVALELLSRAPDDGGAAQGPPDGGPAAPWWEERRVELVAGRTSLAAVLTGAGLQLRADLLLPWAHWVTPGFEPRRYDTRFFVAALPAGQQPRDLHGEGLGGEGEQAAWVAARTAVERHAAGELPMLPPTLVCLEELAAAPSVADLLATRRRLRPVSPWVARGPDGEPVLRVDLDGAGGGEPGP